MSTDFGGFFGTTEVELVVLVFYTSDSGSPDVEFAGTIADAIKKLYQHRYQECKAYHALYKSGQSFVISEIDLKAEGEKRNE